MKLNHIYQGDSLFVLKTLPDCCIDTVVTSPPYWGLRDYGTAKWEGGDDKCTHRRESKKSDKTITGHKNFDEMLGVGDAIQKNVCSYCGAIRIDSQLGLEETPEEYVSNMVNVFKEVKRVLKKEGTCWLNLGDSYAGVNSVGRNDTDTIAYYGKGTSLESKKKSFNTNIKSKNLVGIPWRVAFALQSDGWYLRQDIIWHKPNPMPESVTDRCTKSHEYIFLLTKSAKYYYDNDAIKEPYKESLGGDKKRASINEKFDTAGMANANSLARTRDERPDKSGRNKRSVWTVTTKPFKAAHFATFPENLILPMVKAGCPKDGLILDPFFGAGTVGVVAKKLNLNYVGIELNPEYIKIAKKRILNTEGSLF